MCSKSRFLPLLLVLCGATVLALIIIRPPYEKIAIVESTLGLLSILAGTYLLNGRYSRIALSVAWVRYLVLPVVIAVSLSGLLATPPAISAFVSAVALTLLFSLSRMANIPPVHVVVFAVMLAAAIGCNMYFYYPLVNGVDTQGHLAVASAIIQRGYYSDVIKPTDNYYFPFPVTSIGTSILSSVTRLNLELSLMLLPGIMILMQPLLVFLLSRIVFNDVEAAALSAFIVVTESTVTQMISQPIPQPTAVSLLLLFLVLIIRKDRSRNHMAAAFVIFTMLTATHGAVGLVSIALVAFLVFFERSSHKRIILPLAAIYAAYTMLTEVVDSMVRNVRITAESIFAWIFTPTLRTGIELYGAGSNGLIFIWWGLPVSLALFSLLVHPVKRASSWVYAGLGLLGLSFVVNVIAPELIIDRYGGLIAWLILATVGGRPLKSMARTRHQLVLLVPVILLVSLSAVVDPALSPQYGFYHGYQNPLPTTKLDRTALDWVNGHVGRTIFADTFCGYYLIFSRYQSGTFNRNGIVALNVRDLPSAPGPGYGLFVRLSLSTIRDNQQKDRIINVLYHNGRDLLETSDWVS